MPSGKRRMHSVDGCHTRTMFITSANGKLRCFLDGIPKVLFDRIRSFRILPSTYDVYRSSRPLMSVSLNIVRYEFWYLLFYKIEGTKYFESKYIKTMSIQLRLSNTALEIISNYGDHLSFALKQK